MLHVDARGVSRVMGGGKYGGGGVRRKSSRGGIQRDMEIDGRGSACGEICESMWERGLDLEDFSVSKYSYYPMI